MRKNWHKKYTKRFLKQNKRIQYIIKNYLKKLYPGFHQGIKETFKEKSQNLHKFFQKTGKKGNTSN